FFFQAEDGIRDFHVTGVQTCALPISLGVLVPMAVLRMPPLGVAGTAAVVVGILYLCMIIVRFATPPSRLRLALLAVDMLAIAFVSLLAVLLVAERATLV